MCTRVGGKKDNGLRLCTPFAFDVRVASDSRGTEHQHAGIAVVCAVRAVFRGGTCRVGHNTVLLSFPRARALARSLSEYFLSPVNPFRHGNATHLERGERRKNELRLLCNPRFARGSERQDANPKPVVDRRWPNFDVRMNGDDGGRQKGFFFASFLLQRFG